MGTVQVLEYDRRSHVGMMLTIVRSKGRFMIMAISWVYNIMCSYIEWSCG